MTIRKLRQEVGAVEQLELMLEAEMAKDPVDIDTDYADALAELILEYRNIPASQTDPSAGKATGLSGRKNIVRVAAMILLLLCIVLIPMTHVAEAFSWISIAKFFSPLMEQIGIHINLDSKDELSEVNKLDPSEPVIEDDVMEEFLDLVLTDESDLPDNVDGYPVLPSYLPAGYSFVRAELFSNESMTNLNMTYSDGAQELYIHIKWYKAAIGTSVVMTEQAPEQPDQSRIVLTSDEGVNSAIMDLGFCRYMAWSFMSEDEMFKIMESYEGAIYR